LDLIATFSQGKIDPDMLAEYSPGGKTYASIWGNVVDAAERYNEPGRFTAFIGFERTSLVAGNNLQICPRRRPTRCSSTSTAARR
jgi:hypothetical protein